MAITQPLLSIPDNAAKPKPAYDIEVKGSWNVRNARLSRTIRVFMRNLWINSVALLFVVLLFLGCVLVFLDGSVAKSCSLNNNELLHRIQLLEARVTVLESSRSEGNATHAATMLERRKRSVAGENRDIRAVQFASSNPNVFSLRPLKGVIGPWIEQVNNGRKMDSLGLKLVENNRKLEISRSGMYIIYAQVTYPSKNQANSYSINLISAVENTNSTISICSAVSKRGIDSEVSCYTSTLRSFKNGDIIYLQQMEQNRNINLESSSTYFGVIMLSHE